MFVIEVRPKRAWRGLRYERESVTQAHVTTQHHATSHWMQHSTADRLVTMTTVRSAGRILDLTPDRWRILPCECNPRSLQ